MSAFDDEVRAAKAEIRQIMYSDARLERTSSNQVDRVAGTKTSTSTKNIDCLARLGMKKMRAEDGSIIGTRFEAKLDAEPKVGDVLNYDGQKWKVTEILEAAPDGIADQWKVLVVR